MIHTIVGKIYVSAPVISNIITTTLILICIMPAKLLAAPKNAYVPGVIHGPSGSHAAKNAEPGKDSWICCTKMPTMRPNAAPTAIEGTKIPAGTLHPKDMMTSKVRRIVAIKRLPIICHLWSGSHKRSYSRPVLHSWKRISMLSVMSILRNIFG
jgi:hypothetical protein